MTKILLADDHGVVRKGLKVLCAQFGFTDVDEAENCAGLMKILRKKTYSHLILDLIFPDGTTLEILPNILRLYPDMNILVFSMQSPDIYRGVLEGYGIRHFITKSAPEKLTIQLLRDFLYNKNSIIPVSLEKIVRNPFDSFARREMEVLHYMLMGVGSVEIGNRLNMKPNTVSTLKKRIYEKSNTNNIIELKELVSLYRPEESKED